MKRTFYLIHVIMAAILLSACVKETSPSTTAVIDNNSPTPQVLDSTAALPGTNEPMETFSSDQLGICFSYPQGYTQLQNTETLEIVAPQLPDTDLRGLFWLETSDAYNRSAEVIVDQELSIAGVNADQWTVTVGGEPAVVLDGMPGQDLQRRVYVVHQGTLYVLAFMPTLSENEAANGQMEVLYSAITGSWAWASCSTGN